MAFNQTSSDLAENERKILNAGRFPYESFKVRDFPPPPGSGFALAKICFPFLIFWGGGEESLIFIERNHYNV